MSRLSAAAEVAWQIAAGEAANKGSAFIEKEHIFIGIFSLEKAFAIDWLKARLGPRTKEMEAEYFILEKAAKSLALNMTELRRAARNGLPEGRRPFGDETMHRSEECKKCFRKAEELGKGTVNCLFLLAVILEKPGEIIKDVLKSFKIEPEKLREKIFAVTGDFEQKDGPQMETARPAGAKRDEFVWLARFGRDLVSEAQNGKLMPIEGRRDEMLQLVRTLSRKTKNNPVLVGEAGVGKTAIVEGLAQRIADGKDLPGKKIFEVNVAGLVAGTKYRGEFEDRIENLLKEAKENPEVILFLDEIHNLVGTGRAEGSMDAANILKPALARGDIKCIGATTIAEYRRYIEKDTALERRFQPVMVNEPTAEETLKILTKLKGKFEEHHHIAISPEAISAAIELSVRYFPYRQLPDKAIDIIDEACASVQIPALSVIKGVKQDLPSGGGGGAVDEETVAKVVSKLTGIPVSKLTEKDAEKLLNLEKHLREKIHGQDEAIKVVANKIRLAKTAMRDKNKPLGVFLFLGPTGVGKTLFAKTIADVLFGSEKDIIRLDMSEYKEKHEVSKLIGAPPGYVGYEEEGQLTGKLRNKPYSVVLLDEIEKAHPDVFDLFLQLFDEGRLTDSKGRTIDGRNAIFIMTSNLPPENRMGFKPSATPSEEDETIASVRKSFKPEFINRIDKIVIFKSLDRAVILEIVEKQMRELTGQISREYGISLTYSKGIPELLAEAGYSERSGAREIQRTIERLIKEAMSEEILRRQSSGEMIKGTSLKLETADGGIRFIWQSKEKTPGTRPPEVIDD